MEKMKRKLKKEKKKASVINRANFICQAGAKRSSWVYLI
jgi:hypothetical protein